MVATGERMTLKQRLPFMVFPVQAKPLKNPNIVFIDEDLKSFNEFSAMPTSEIVKVVNGEHENFQDLFSTVYCGHQFGYFVPQLGDGRASFLGTFKNHRGNLVELQMKGLGRTPFSRRGDGRAVFRSSLREYLCSHAMKALGIPTTEALALIDSEEIVYREEKEWGAIVLRAAPSFLRFGHVEFLYHHGYKNELEKLLDYTIEHFYPDYYSHPNAYVLFFQDLVKRTAKLMANWQTYGFCHGVMNTDNMSLLGLTIDYGPFGFLEAFDLKHICNHSDHEGRYAFGEQPLVALWNLERLADCLGDFIDQDTLKRTLGTYRELFNLEYLRLMKKRLGLQSSNELDAELMNVLLNFLQVSAVDYHGFFRNLAEKDGLEFIFSQLKSAESKASFDQFKKIYQARIDLEWGREEESEQKRFDFMNSVNPIYVLRNYLAQKIIDQHRYSDQGNKREQVLCESQRLLKVLQRPFDWHEGCDDLSRVCPAEFLNIEISCSS